MVEEKYLTVNYKTQLFIGTVIELKYHNEQILNLL